MPARLVLYFAAAEHCLFRWSGGALAPLATFSADERGLGEFRDRLAQHRGALVTLVADVTGEDFHEDQVPYLRGAERQTVIQRRLAQRYRDTRLAVALSLGYVAEERRNERLLLASFTNVQQFIAWLDAIADAGARLAGVYSAPIVAPALAARLGAGGERSILVSVNRAGLRQCFLEEGRLRFARLEPTLETAPRPVAALVRAETERMAQYLATLRALPRDGPAVRVLVIAPDGQRAQFEQTLKSDAHLAFRIIGMADAMRMAGLSNEAAGRSAEELYCHLAVRDPPAEQFARREDRHGFVLWRLRRAIVAAGALAFAACAAYAGTLWMERSSVHERLQALRAETRAAQQQIEHITASFPVTQTSTENLRAMVLEFRSLAARTASPEDALAFAAGALMKFPQLELDSILWTAGAAEAVGEGKPAPATETKPAAEVLQTLEISGRVNASDQSDYRSITQQVQRFASALDADPGWQVVNTRLPFDVTPQGTLSGDIGAAAEREPAPRFTIVVARKQ